MQRSQDAAALWRIPSLAMPHQLRHLKTLEEARRLLWEALPQHIREGRFGGRETPIAEAVGFVLDTDILASEDLPPFDRSTMDGYAVWAEDTFRASERLPAQLEVVGEIRMGEDAALSLSHRQAAAISTGGMLPDGGDAVVMVEHTHLREDHSVEVLRPVAPGENIVRRGDDVREGEAVLAAGHRLRPQDVSALAGLGIAAVTVRRPRVAVLSTGSELVPHTEEAGSGRIRDMNGPALQAAARALGAEPADLGLVTDDPEAIRQAMRQGLAEADLLLVSGGTSVGVEDVVPDLIDSLGKPGVLVHGLAVKPGRPVVIGLVGEVPVFGMPGHPTSCLTIFRELVAPLLRLACGDRRNPLTRVRARITGNFTSQAGREEFVPVRLRQRDGFWEATPLLGPSALISTLVRADGLVRIPAACQGLCAGDEVEVEPFE
ncbi:MAG TPA: gephyrin-like molybdotransferase Glp [Armatimonadota bacterium]|nr:gephyrin-like molybdotransferase Glp [Armatimonadota bacterium]